MPEVFNLPVHSLSPIYHLISLPVNVFPCTAKIAKRLSVLHPPTMMEFPLPAGGVSVPKYHLRVSLGLLMTPSTSSIKVRN